MACDRKIGPFDCCSVVCGDCLELMKQLPGVALDAVVTDPPYGTGWVRGGGSVGVFQPKHERPDWDIFSTLWIDPFIANKWAIFCPKNKARSIKRKFSDAGVTFYRKTNPRPGGCPVEAIVVSPAPFEWEFLEKSAYNGDSPLHPCQKPEEIMEWVITELDAEFVLDPYAGSGTTLVAAKKLGRHFLGFEISPEYCQIARDRLARVEAQPALFAPKPEQLELGQ